MGYPHPIHPRETAVLTNFPYHTPVQFAELFIGLLAVLLIAFPPFDGEANIYWIEMWALVLCSRWVAIRALATAIEFPTPKIFPVMLVSDAVETACWLLAWFSPRVWWAGKWWRISREGKLREG